MFLYLVEGKFCYCCGFVFGVVTLELSFDYANADILTSPIILVKGDGSSSLKSFEFENSGIVPPFNIFERFLYSSYPNFG